MHKLLSRILFVGIIFGLFTGGLAAQENPFSTSHAKGLIPLDAERVSKIEATWPRVDRVNLNWLGLERVNKVKALKGKARLAAPSARPIGQEIESQVHAPGVAIQAVSLSEDLLDDLPVSVDNSLLPYFPPIRSQGAVGSCASFATTYYQLSYMTAFQRGLDIRDDGDNTNKYSPKWTYNLINDGADNGSYFDDNYRLLEWHGAATWAEFPYDDNFRAWCLVGSVWRNALSAKTRVHQYLQYVSSDTGLELAKQLLTNGYILVFGTYINSWQGTVIQDDPSTPDDDNEVGKDIGYWVNGYLGSHAMTIVGYNDAIWTDINGNGTIDAGEKGAFRVANSWGADWMDGGFVWASYDALRSVSAVPGGPSEGRIGALQNDKVFILTARDYYSPTLIGELTLNHARRYQLGLATGQSDTSVTEPQTGWIMFGFYQQGGAYAFDGSTTACDGTFVFDYTDVVVPGEARRYYVQLWDQIAGDPAVLSSFKLIDTTTEPDTEILCAQTPVQVDNDIAYPYVDYAYYGPAYNHPPALTYGYVSPTIGTTATTYSFHAYYDDSLDGNAPTVKNVYIDDIPYTMTLYSGSSSSGWFRYQTALGLGTHGFRFYFEDGSNGLALFPPAGTIEGPIVGLPHNVSTPTAPSGETNPAKGTSYSYSTGGSSCDQGHDVQYRFDWGDGAVSDWLPVGQTSAMHAWSSSGSFSVRAQARCSIVPSIESSWSAALPIYVDFVMPFTESFPGSSFPQGWTQQNVGATGTRWAVTNTSHAGGQTREMRCSYQNVHPATTRLVTPPINTTGFSSLRLSFKHFLNAYSAGCVLKVQTSPDGTTWTDEAWAVDSTSSNIGPETVGTILTHNLNIETTYVAFVIDGDLFTFDYWYIDDISLDQATSARVDFNGDGQEDILWRNYGVGVYQGLNVVWLMNPGGAPSPLKTGAGQAAPREGSVILGTKAAASYPAPVKLGSSGAEGAKSAPKTIVEGKKAPRLKPGQVMRAPLELGRAAGPARRGDIRGQDPRLRNVQKRKDAVAASALGAGEEKLAALQMVTEIVFSQVADTAWEIVGVGDFDGDGDPDLLWRNLGTGPLQGLSLVWYMNGTEFVSEAFFSWVADTAWRIVGTGDFDGDGDPDLLWRYYGPGGNQGLNIVWYLNGLSYAEAVYSQVTDTTWDIAGTGDFDGDGDPDLLWRNTGTGPLQGLNIVWYMNGAQFVSEAVYSWVSDLAWVIAGTGDYDGDGDPDILWRNYGTGPLQGVNVVWYMNGIAFVSEEVFSIVADTTWRILNR